MGCDPNTKRTDRETTSEGAKIDAKEVRKQHLSGKHKWTVKRVDVDRKRE